MFKKILLLSVLLISFCFSFSGVAYATSSGKGEIDNPSLSESKSSESSSYPKVTEKNGVYYLDSGIGNVTIDDASSWAERKGSEAIHFLQTIVQPFAIIVFILTGMLSLFGILGNPSLIFKGIVGMVIGAIIYAGVLYAPELLDIWINWISS